MKKSFHALAALLMVVAFIAAGCDGTETPAGTAGQNGIVSAQEKVSGTSPDGLCTNGYIEVKTGIDTNSNGQLDSGEVDLTQYVCNGTNGTDGATGAQGDKGDKGDTGDTGGTGGTGSDGDVALVSITTEAAGANCENGGSKVEAGLDANGDGILDSTEVSSTGYICNGAEGEDSSDLTVATKHAVTGLITVNDAAAAVSGADVVVTFNVKVDGKDSNAYTTSSGAYRYAYSETYNTGTAKPYVSTSIPATSIKVAAGASAGTYVVTIPDVASAIGTEPTRIFVRMSNGTNEASVVADVNGAPRSVVSDQGCMNCHGNHIWREANSTRTYHKAVEGVGGCVVCHVNKDRGNLVTYVHGIHNSHDMPAGEKTIKSGWTYKTSYPGNMQNCSACHDSAEALATVLDAPVSYNLCMSCHDTWDGFDNEPSYHADYTANTNCGSCHTGTGVFGKVGDKHNGAIVAKGANQDHEKGKEISMEITGVVVSGTTVTVTWKAFNPITNAEYDPCNAEANIASGPVFFNTGANNIALLFGFAQGNDWVNAGVGTSPGQPVSATKLTTTNTTCSANIATSTVTLPTNSATKAIVGLMGKPHVTNTATSTGTSRARIPTPTREFMVADGSLPTDLRRNIIDSAKCVKCHEGTLYQHGGDRVDNTQVCVICHNAASNEKNVRVDTYGVDATEAYDGKVGQTYDLRTMIHSIHSAGETNVPIIIYRGYGIYAFGGADTVIPNWPTDENGHLASGVTATIYGSTSANTHNFHAVTYPRLLNDCEACHVSGSYNVPDQAKAVAVTDADAGASPWAVQTDDVLKGAAAASCMSCHKSTDKFTQASLSAHAAQNGWTPAAFTNGRADILDGAQVETCVVCHK